MENTAMRLPFLDMTRIESTVSANDNAESAVSQARIAGIRKYHLALAMVVLLDAALVVWGLQEVLELHQEGYVLVALSVLLAWFHRWAARRLMWLFQEAYRWLTALLMAGVVGIEGFMHLLNIPHIEGWWAPMLGGGAFATVITAWVHKIKKKP